MAPKRTNHPLEVIRLPETLISRVDVLRVVRELETAGDSAAQHAYSHTKSDAARFSAILEALVEENQLDLAKKEERDRLVTFLKDLKKEAPTIHMSFAAEPPSAFTVKLIRWLRSEIHPLMLLDIGLQPSIAAGCIIRTTSKYFDCSMRQHLLENKPKLLELLKAPTHA